MISRLKPATGVDVREEERQARDVQIKYKPRSMVDNDQEGKSTENRTK